MPRIKGEELEKVTMNLFKADVNWFRKHHGQGYSEIIRDIVRLFVIRADQRALRFGTGEFDE